MQRLVAQQFARTDWSRPYLIPLHGKAKVLKTLIANIGAALQHVRSAAERFGPVDRRA